MQRHAVNFWVLFLSQNELKTGVFVLCGRYLDSGKVSQIIIFFSSRDPFDASFLVKKRDFVAHSANPSVSRLLQSV